jgi:hypothetical protein
MGRRPRAESALSAITIPGARHQDTPHYRNETSYARLGQGTR